MLLIFHLGTLKPHGLNVDFFLKHLDVHMRFYLAIRGMGTTCYLFNDMSHSELNLALRKAQNVSYKHHF